MLQEMDLLRLFTKAGADDFIMKPFPCEKGALTRELLRILDSRNNATADALASPDP
jgi:FixJ family two-component response regulator